jgi:copper chaperone CopZ
MPRLLPSAVLAVVLLASPVSAELRRAEFTMPGMDCAYCNGAMSGAIKKLEGVESIDMLPDKGTAVIRLKADNKITLQQLRRAIKSFGYEVKGAEITARGRVTATPGSAMTLDLLNGAVLQIAGGVAQASDAIVEVTGTVKAGEKDQEILTIATIR